MSRPRQFAAPHQGPDTDFLDRHMEIVRPMAGRLARQFRVTNELEDVVRVGVLGLVKAAATYNSEKGTERFWAWSRVRLEILSAYSCGARQHSGGDGYQWNSCRRPLLEALATPTVPPEPEPPPLPTFKSLTPTQQSVLRLIYEDGRSERAAARESNGISLRRVRAEHHAAIECLRQVLSPQPAA